MNVVTLIALLIYTFGLFAFGTMAGFEVRQLLRRRDGDEAAACEGCPAGVADLVLTFVCCAWFAVNILLALAPVNPAFESAPVIIAFIVVVYAFPPLLMQVVRVEARERARHPAWRAAVWIVAVASAGFAATGVLLVLDILENVPRMFRNLGLSINGLFAVAGVYSAALLLAGRSRDESSSERRLRAVMISLFVSIVGIAGAAVLASLGYLELGEFLDKVVLRSLPLAFLSAGAWFENRFRFFDLFVKRGISLALTLVLLTAYFSLVARLDALELGWSRPWVYAVTLLPLVLALPWIYRRLGRALDALWLGRRFTPVQAVKHFLSVLGRATSEDELVEQAERGLSAIFQAPARIDLEIREAPPDDFRQAVEIPVRSDGRTTGAIRLGRRTNQAPWFSQDLVLLGSLAEVFATMLDNVRLQRKKQEQEDRARELSLHASRSELKALRAQIDPHFLFNALNAIAGLIHRDPLRADRAVEQLAEVFRYTLRRSESEWAALEDELELAGAYLEIQQARFGSRLTYSIECEPAVRACRVPTMMLQTLVENAVKHGIGSSREAGALEIRAARLEGRLRVEVADTGPGFPEGSPDRGPSTPGRESGYGLHNVRERLRGHFGDDAALDVARDSARGRTVVALVLPLERLEPSAGRTAGSAGGAST